MMIQIYKKQFIHIKQLIKINFMNQNYIKLKHQIIEFTFKEIVYKNQKQTLMIRIIVK